MCSREKGEAPGRLHKATKKRRGTKCHQNLTFLKFGNRPSCRPACFRGWQSPITSEWNITRHTRHNRNSRHNSLQLDAISKHSLCFWGSFFTWAFKTSRIGKWHFLIFFVTNFKATSEPSTKQPSFANKTAHKLLCYFPKDPTAFHKKQ